ncbi:uncharacterized protein LAESUDRAFT_756193 [Laetiporus sulphureus 93-53]|uniref:Uncharacterized protein n=1 Tax=Laetiporus sulphureus 93-53 TaxID=1314785 RepID=A0A165G8K4_9APHY|nr:uncharacterized protein LAESUDRAFT_756193 [Laetiporus sulphureus 93-53]KZT09979.1 hypothetical protein LAESUDRAFT_756193 [Laetiporus sulphureus 93-53]
MADNFTGLIEFTCSYCIYFILTPSRVIYFTGCIDHGGTASIASAGEELLSWAYRFTTIGYPSSAIIEGSSKHAMTTLPMTTLPKSNELLHITPEITGVNCNLPLNERGIPQIRSWINHSNLTKDEQLVMDPVKHVSWMA